MKCLGILKVKGLMLMFQTGRRETKCDLDSQLFVRTVGVQRRRDT